MQRNVKNAISQNNVKGSLKMITTTTTSDPITVTRESVEKQLKYPSKWNVLFWNDDVTPMGFVVYVLSEVFKHGDTASFDLMMKIHNEGKAVVGSYIKSIAESKMIIAKSMAEKAGYPLEVTIEKEIQ